LRELKKELNRKAREERELGGYIEQFLNCDLSDGGDGVPIAIKDNINVKGWEITCSSEILQGYIAPYDATVIEKMREKGLTPYGRTNMDQFAMGSSTETSYYGPTLNPLDRERVPGGSSGGSAAVVGAGLAIAALGSDTGGSIRQPAAFCGVVGMKPTYGRVSRYGLVAFSSSLDQIGPITQNVEDAALLYSIIAGPDHKDSTCVDLPVEPIELKTDRKFTVGVVENYLEEAAPEISKPIWEMVRELEKRGHTIKPVKLINSQIDVATYYIIATAEASSNLARFDGMRYGKRVEGKNLRETYKLTRALFGEEVKRRILLGTFVLSSGYYDAYYLRAQRVRHLIKQEFKNLFKEMDLLLGPVTPTLPFKFGEKKSPLEMYLNDIYTIGANLAGLPAISVPIAKSGHLSVSLQLIADHFQEPTLFQGAYLVEQLASLRSER
jgi:aspartyl-tRNA(Asn)/glutamyl-tRNA(Gln) amidotransferase subunit A